MDISQSMSALLHLYKEMTGKTLLEMSNDFDMSRSSIQRYMSGGNPNARSICHLANKMDVDAELLLQGAPSDRQVDLMVKLFNLLGPAARIPPDERREFVEHFMACVRILDRGGSDA